jgi:hypothetical protein
VDPMHRRAGGERGLATAIEAFEKPRAAPQGHSAPRGVGEVDVALFSPRKSSDPRVLLLELSLHHIPPGGDHLVVTK